MLLSPRRPRPAALTYISAHDVNLLYLRQLLGINWQVDLIIINTIIIIIIIIIIYDSRP